MKQDVYDVGDIIKATTNDERERHYVILKVEQEGGIVWYKRYYIEDGSIQNNVLMQDTIYRIHEKV